MAEVEYSIENKWKHMGILLTTDDRAEPISKYDFNKFDYNKLISKPCGYKLLNALSYMGLNFGLFYILDNHPEEVNPLAMTFVQYLKSVGTLTRHEDIPQIRGDALIFGTDGDITEEIWKIVLEEISRKENKNPNKAFINFIKIKETECKENNDTDIWIQLQKDMLIRYKKYGEYY